MKEHNTSTTITTQKFSNLLNSHDMRAMSEYYSKTLIGNCENSNERQRLCPEPIECSRTKDSVANK